MKAHRTECLTFADTVTFTNVGGGAIDINGGAADEFTGSATFAGDITNDAGHSVSIQGISGTGTAVTLTGDITETAMSASQGINIDSNSGGTILFSGNITQNLTDETGFTITNNMGTDINFGGELDTTIAGTGNGFIAQGGGTLTVSNTNNSMTVANGLGVEITDMTISTAGANFANVNVAGSTTNGVLLMDNTGGPILIGTVGDMAGDSGTIANTSGDAVVIDNSANVTVSGLVINAMAGQRGVAINKDTTGTQTVNLNDLDINGGTRGVDVTGNGTGTLNMTASDTTIDNSTDRGFSVDDIDAGTIQVNNVDVTGDNTIPTMGINVSNSNASFTFDADTSVTGTNGTAFNVNDGTGTVNMAGDITNTAGRSIAVQNISGGSVTMTGTVNDTGTGILVNGNTGGNVNLAGNYTLDTTTNNAVTITGNTGSSTSIGDFKVTTTTGQGFVATGGGNLTVNGSGNTIATATGTGLTIDGMNITSQALFESVNVNGAANGIVMNNVTGSTITVGDNGNSAGQGGTIQNTTGDGASITNTANVVLNGVTITNAGDAVGENAVSLAHTNANNMSATLNNVTISTAHDGLSINGTGGTNTFNVTTTGDTITAAETALEVQGRLSTANLTDDITNTMGRSISVHNVTAGTMTHTGTVDDNGGTGVSIANNTGGNINLLGTYNLNTAGNDAMTITNNTGASIDATNLNIDTTSGNGFTATGGGTLTVSGTTNTIDTTTGVGLHIEDMTIGAAGANFQSVNVNGAASGILLRNLTGGQVLVGNAAGASNSSKLTTTGNAIELTNVANVDLNHVQIINASGGDGIVVTHNNSGTTGMDVTINDLNLDAVAGNAINLTADNDSNSFALRLNNSDIENGNVVMDVTGGAHFGLLVDNTDINTDVGSTDDAFSLVFHDGATSADVTIQNNSNFTADDGSGLFVDSFDATAKSIRLLVQDSTFTNSTGTDFAADITSRGTTIMQTTIQGNTFTAAGATHDMAVQSSGTASSQMRLNLGGEATDPQDFNTAAGQGTLFVSQAGTSVFSIFERDDTFAGLRNNDPVNSSGTFQNLAVPPTLPVIP